MEISNGAGAGVVIAGAVFGTGDGALLGDDEDEDEDPTGVLRTMVFRSGFGSTIRSSGSSDSGSLSAFGSLEVEATGDWSDEDAIRCRTSSKATGRGISPVRGDPDGVVVGVGLRLTGREGTREGGLDVGREAGRDERFLAAIAAT